MKSILIAAFALLSLTASAQVNFLTNQANMSFTFFVTNMPVDVQAELEKTFRIRNSAVAVTNANGTANTNFLPSYAYVTNYVMSGTDTNGEPVFSQVVTTNTTLSRQAFLNLSSSPALPRTAANMREILMEWCAAEQRRIGALRNDRASQ
jgi:hypothetical protein